VWPGAVAYSELPASVLDTEFIGTIKQDLGPFVKKTFKFEQICFRFNGDFVDKLGTEARNGLVGNHR